MIRPPVFLYVCLDQEKSNKKTDESQVDVILDMAGEVSYNPRDMDSLKVLELPVGSLSSLLLWSWWAVPAAR